MVSVDVKYFDNAWKYCLEEAKKLHRDERDYPEAKEAYMKAINLTELNSPERATCLYCLACLLKDNAEYSEAKEKHIEALKIRQSFLLEERLEDPIFDFAKECGRFLGTLDKSTELGMRILRLVRGCSKSLLGLANVYGYIRNYPQAIEFYLSALKISELLCVYLPYKCTRAVILANLAENYNAINDGEMAKSSFEKAIGNFEVSRCKQGLSRRNNLRFAVVLSNFSEFLVSSNRDRVPKEERSYRDRLAIRHSKEAFEIFTRYYQRHPVIASNKNSRAFIHRVIGGQKNLKKAENLAEEARQIFHEKIEKPNVNDRNGLIEIYLNLARIKIDMYTQFGETKLEEAHFLLLQVIEISSSILTELKNFEEKITYYEKESEAYHLLEQVYFLRNQTIETCGIADSRKAVILRRILSERIPNIQSSNADVPTLDNFIQFAITHRTTFIVYSLSNFFISQNKITVWIISDCGIKQANLSTQDIQEFTKDAPRLFKQFPFCKSRGEVNVDFSFYEEVQELCRDEGCSIRVKEAANQRFQEKLRGWYNTLIAPIEQYLPKDHLETVTIIPDGFLAQMPFAAFRDQEGRYLIEKHPISIAPSIKTLELLSLRSKIFTEKSLIIGNPNTGNPADDLEKASEEAALVNTIIGLENSVQLFREGAKVTNTINQMKEARWIHLACHGETGIKPKLDSYSVFEGRLKLAPDEEHLQGHLHANEIAQLSLNVELVFMSACFTGTGKIQQEGVIGPVWAFLAAGASSTVATYWKLYETALTVDMVQEFYKHVFGRERPRLNFAQALQKAMCYGIEQDREHPHRWGAFFHSGLNAPLTSEDRHTVIPSQSSPTCSSSSVNPE